MSYENFIAFRYLKSPRADRSISAITVISIIGVALGVMALIVVLSVMNGFERDLKKALLGVNPHLTLYPFTFGELQLSNYKDTIQNLKKVIPAKTILPFTENQSILMGKDQPLGALIRGINPAEEKKMRLILPFLRRTVSNGELTDQEKLADLKYAPNILDNLANHWENFQHGSDQIIRKRRVQGIILGMNLARKLDVGLNDLVTLVSSKEKMSPLGRLPRVLHFKVVGFYESGLAGYDEVLAYIDIKQAQKIFQLGNNITGLAIYLSKINQAQKYRNLIKKHFPLQFIIRTWIDNNKNLFSVIQLEKFGLGVILTLIILVAAANIISSLIMLVFEKRKDISVLKALGATNTSIQKIFIVQGSIIGLIGTFLGELFGLFLCWLIDNFDVVEIPPGVYPNNHIPLHVEFSQLLWIAAISILICFIVTVIPAKKAAQLDPIDGIRFQ